ncbi:MAG TPA: hypothetical protein PKD18_05175 [Saprospiraceae bacterium]|nr:hypothetical protein [Saprospiraceae bacterium]
MASIIQENCKIIENQFIDSEPEYFSGKKDQPFILEYKWEGKVDSIIGDNIYGTLYSAQEDEFDEIEFSKNDLSIDDKELLQEGALFYLFLGYDHKDGVRRKARLFKFRRIVLENRIDQILENLNNYKAMNIISSK